MKNVKIEIIEGIGKETNKPYEALKITIGEWDSGLVFPESDRPLMKSKFELDYIKKVLLGEDILETK